MTSNNNLELLHTDRIGTGLYYKADAQHPHSKYIVVYPEFNGMQTEPEELPFQVGQINKVGVNGVTNEIMLMALLHRIEQIVDGGDRTHKFMELRKHLRRAGEVIKKGKK